MFITVTLEAPDKLSRETWRFRIDDKGGEVGEIEVKLVYWANSTRATRRHGWTIAGKHFDTYSREHRAAVNAPEVPAHVLQAFEDELLRRLTYAGVQGE